MNLSDCDEGRWGRGRRGRRWLRSVGRRGHSATPSAVRTVARAGPPDRQFRPRAAHLPSACQADGFPVGQARIRQARWALRHVPTAVGLLLMLPLAVLTTLPAWADEVAARVRHEPLLAPSSCTGRFVRHSLPHTTRAADRPARAYDTNGAGVALADLDGDRLIDIVLAGLRAPVTVLWNRGGLQFERMELAEAGTRAVAAVDVDGNGRFVPAPEWGLGATESGRGMAFADLDLDGDLDIVNNLEAPALLFENRLCGGVGLEADLRWPGSPNRRAIGASVHLATATYLRTVQAGSGYLSSDPARLHFGLPAAAADLTLTITWPDGAVTHTAGIRP